MPCMFWLARTFGDALIADDEHAALAGHDASPGHVIWYVPPPAGPVPQKDLDHIIALYDGEILYTDGYISKLLDKFTEYGILDDTLTVVFGDHGDEFYEHGSTAHGHSLYNELIRIPLTFTWTSEIPQNRQQVSKMGQKDPSSPIKQHTLAFFCYPVYIHSHFSEPISALIFAGSSRIFNILVAQ